MNKTKAQKLKEYEDLYDQYESMVAISSESISTREMNFCKSSLYEKSENKIKSIHNRVMRIALKNKNISNDDEYFFKNQTSLVFTNNIIDTTRLLKKLQKKVRFNILGCVHNKRYENIAYTEKLSKMCDSSSILLKISQILISPYKSILTFPARVQKRLLDSIKK